MAAILGLAAAFPLVFFPHAERPSVLFRFDPIQFKHLEPL
jgi:hypothetical protein